MTNYDRRPVTPLQDAWLLDANGVIVGVEIAQAKNQKTYLPGSGTDGALVADVTGNLTGNVTGNVTGDVTGNVTGDLTGNVTGDLVGIAANLTTIATGNSVSVPADTQVAIFGSLTVDGTLTVGGEVRVCAWPA